MSAIMARRGSIAAATLPYATWKPSAEYVTRTGAATVVTGLPLSDSAAAALVNDSSWEPRSGNATANGTTGPAAWADLNIGPYLTDTYWFHVVANGQAVTGNFTGTTDQIIQWAAHKWGLDEDIFRAVACKESWWDQSAAGDLANGITHSFGLMGIRDSSNDQTTLTHNAMGGYAYSSTSTAVNCDMFGAWIRSAYDGTFYDGGAWLYGGGTVGSVAEANGWDYVKWGCIGFHFSGQWYTAPAITYIGQVQDYLADRVWEGGSF